MSETTFVGFGFELPPAATIDTSLGTLRAVRDDDRHLASQLSLDPPALTRGCLLEVSVAEREPERSTDTIFVPDIDDVRWHRIALSAALAARSGQPRCFLPWLLVHCLPHGTPVGSTVRQFVKGPQFTSEQMDSMRAWIRATSDSGLSDIAVGHAISMLSRMPPSIDALIDAVIVWENVFGVGAHQELGYRISMNMACVLAREPSVRISLQKEIKSLYNTRSEVVHGKKLPRQSDLIRLQERSKELTLDALSAMLTTHQPLLGRDADAFVAFVLGGPTAASGPA